MWKGISRDVERLFTRRRDEKVFYTRFYDLLVKRSQIPESVLILYFPILQLKIARAPGKVFGRRRTGVESEIARAPLKYFGGDGRA